MNPYTNYTLDFNASYDRERRCDLHCISLSAYHSDPVTAMINGELVVLTADDLDRYGEMETQYGTFEISGQEATVTISVGEQQFTASRSWDRSGLSIQTHTLENVRLRINGMDYPSIAHENGYPAPPAGIDPGTYCGYVKAYHEKNNR